MIFSSLHFKCRHDARWTGAGGKLLSRSYKINNISKILRSLQKLTTKMLRNHKHILNKITNSRTFNNEKQRDERLRSLIR